MLQDQLRIRHGLSSCLVHVSAAAPEAGPGWIIDQELRVHTESLLLGNPMSFRF